MKQFKSGSSTRCALTVALLGPCLLALPLVAREDDSNPVNQGEMFYEVPAGQHLSEPVYVSLRHARFNIKSNGEEATFRYRLPRELDGTSPKSFSMNGTFQEGSWKLATKEYAGDNTPMASADCTGDERNFACKITYGKNKEGDDGIFELNTASADRYLQTRTDLSAEQVSLIKQAQVALSHEPIGIVHVHRD